MTEKFKAGDTVRLILGMPRNRNTSHTSRGDKHAESLGFDPYMEFKVLSAQHGELYVEQGDKRAHMYDDRFESMDEWAKHQVPAPAEKAAEINKFLGLPPSKRDEQMAVQDCAVDPLHPIMQAANTGKDVAVLAGFHELRQKAWDAYAMSRNKAMGAKQDSGLLYYTADSLTGPTPRAQGWRDGFAAGFAARTPEHHVSAFIAKARVSDPATSKAAAAAVQRKVGKIKDIILAQLQHGDLTGHQLAAITGIPLNSITPRFAQLSRAGLIHVCGGTGRESLWRLGNGFSMPVASCQTEAAVS